MNVVIILVSAYIAAQMMSDIASLKIILLFGMSMDAGTLIYPITFTLRDLVHKKLGKSATKTLILSAAVINVVMALTFSLVSKIAPDTTIGLQEEFSIVLSPVWRIVIASIVAEVIAELIDGEVYAAWANRMGNKHQWGRVLSSNAISVPIDSAIFCSVAFIGTMPSSVVLAIFVSNVVLKLIVTVLSIPGIYLVKANDIRDNLR